MAQPPPYTPATAFLSYSAVTPTFPGQQLDAEFANLQTIIGDVETNLALIQRDDGALANASVDFDQLTDVLKAAFGDTTALAALNATVVTAVAAATSATASASSATSSASSATSSASAASVSAAAAAASAALAAGGVFGPASSVDAEIVLFSGTTGKLVKRAAGTGYVKETSGVHSTQAVPIPIADGGTNAITAVAALASLGGISSTTTVSAAGLATGGGDLSTNRTITVTASSGAQAVTGTDTTTAVTPAALAASRQVFAGLSNYLFCA